jgi:tetratricopeptide (TPR) repeat protein
MTAMPDKRAKKTARDLQAIYAKAVSHEKQGMLVEAARSYRFLLSKWPEPAAYYNYGVVLKKLKAYDEAILNYKTAIALRPDYAEAYVNLGSICFEKADFETALDHYDTAIRHNPTLVEAYYNRGVVLQELRRHDDALADYNTALALQPDYYLAYLNKSVILYELKRKAEAARNYEQILRRQPDHIDANWNLGILRLSEGDFSNGWRLSESRLRLHAAHYAGLLQRPYWRGAESLAGKTIFLKWEQGFGDTIQFCRYARLVQDAGANVILSVQDPLRRLIRTLDDGISVIGQNEIPQDYDYHCFLMSLPHAFATTLETIPRTAPYLRGDPAETVAWTARLENKSGPKIGLVWAGGLRADITCARRNDANRSLTLERLLPLVEIPGTAFVSLQKGPPAAQLTAAPARHAIHDWTDELTDFAATAALIEALDLVVTVDTAVAHLAAALGKQVWILVPWTSCWRWLEARTDSPWYPSVTLFRQDERGNWDQVIAAVKQELERLAAAKIRA